MEYLDIYDEQQNPLGKETREKVHRDALWHKTVHCWLYDRSGNVYFQVRREEQQLYTTASGHVLAGETVKEAFGREIFEEIGVNLDYERAEVIEVVKFVMDRPKKDGTMFRDRAFAHIFGYRFDEESSFHFDQEEVLELVKVNAKEVLTLFEKEAGNIVGEGIFLDGHRENRILTMADFLVNAHETALGKYGTVLRFVAGKASTK